VWHADTASVECFISVPKNAEARCLLAKVKQQQRGFNDDLFEVGVGRLFWKSRPKRGPARAARARVNARPSDGRGDPDGLEGLLWVPIPNASDALPLQYREPSLQCVDRALAEPCGFRSLGGAFLTVEQQPRPYEERGCGLLLF